MNEQIEQELKDLNDRNTLIKNKRGLIIKKYYKTALHKYGINIDEYGTYQDIIFMINDFVNNCEDLLDDEYDELDLIANEIQERQYYENTNK